jgi:RNA polymerase sigma-70 factor (ECF subfamily)
MALPKPDDHVADRSDAQLAESAARGESNALAGIYSRHARGLFAVAYRLLQRREDAEDVVHDVFVGLPEALRRYKERDSLGAWLRTITARVALQRIRHEGARTTVALDDEQVPAKPASLDASITIERALAELAPNLRAVLVLKEIEGFSHAEIAEMLNISVSASEVRLHRALHALRAMLIKENEQ